MTTTIKDKAAEYKAGLPTARNGGTSWTIESFSTYVNLRYPHITVVSGQEWTGSDVKYKFNCSIHGDYESLATHLLKNYTGCQCTGCKGDKTKHSAGTNRKPRATKADKNLAAQMYADGLGYNEIGRRLGRTHSTIRCWLNPEVAQQNIQRVAEYDAANREYKRAIQRRYTSEYEHGRASNRASGAISRLHKTNTPEFVFIDNEWCEVDRKETYRIHKDYLLPPSEKKAIQELYLECQHITEKTGIEHHVDHIQPLSKGGEHAMFNLQILPASENLSKHNEFRPEDQQLLIQRLFN